MVFPAVPPVAIVGAEGVVKATMFADPVVSEVSSEDPALVIRDAETVVDVVIGKRFLFGLCHPCSVIFFVGARL